MKLGADGKIIREKKIDLTEKNEVNTESKDNKHQTKGEMVKLRCKAFRRQNIRSEGDASFVLLAGGKYIAFNAIGDLSPELPDSIAYDLLGKYSDILEVVPASTKHVEMETKMKTAEKNK